MTAAVGRVKRMAAPDSNVADGSAANLDGLLPIKTPSVSTLCLEITIKANRPLAYPSGPSGANCRKAATVFGQVVGHGCPALRRG